MNIQELLLPSLPVSTFQIFASSAVEGLAVQQEQRKREREDAREMAKEVFHQIFLTALAMRSMRSPGLMLIHLQLESPDFESTEALSTV